MPGVSHLLAPSKCLVCGEVLFVSRREFSLLLPLLLSALTGACKAGPPPEDRRPEITVETILEDLNRQRINVPAEDGASEPSTWRFFPNEPKEVEILEKQAAGDKAILVIDLRTRTSPRAEQQGIKKKLAGKLRLHYELKSYFVVRKWEIVGMENISFAYQKEAKE
jgi:hypothetical protein